LSFEGKPSMDVRLALMGAFRTRGRMYWQSLDDSKESGEQKVMLFLDGSITTKNEDA
jgi:hypothetical protein